MSIPNTTLDDLADHFSALSLYHHSRIVVHSRLTSFGRIQGGAAAVYDCLRRTVGPAATIAVPTYTLGLGKDDPYDPHRSPGLEVGCFSEYVRSLPTAVRSRCPLHNHAAVGPLASILSKHLGTNSIGAGS